MSRSPERGAAALNKASTVVAVGLGSLCITGNADPHTAGKNITKDPKKIEIHVDKAQIAMLDHAVHFIAVKKNEPGKYDLPHTTLHHNSTKPINTHVHLHEWEATLRNCESGGDYHENTGNGFYGAYQFMTSTWNDIAKKTGHNNLVGMLPSDASKQEQDMMVVLNTDMSEGGLSSQNPGCFHSQHLSEFPPKN